MSDSYARIYATVRRIPRGKVATYGQVARVAGLGRHARLVGYALHGCPRDVPWHRVINAKGRISLPADSTAAMTQRRRLLEEGVVFLGPRVDLQRYGWQPAASAQYTGQMPGVANSSK
ncbi:MAG TPA: MGMT family protein [Salinisphaeraceae bacterium]|nr:MGMT family protein [Salinisphaeraceae bacterium]